MKQLTNDEIASKIIGNVVDYFNKAKDLSPDQHQDIANMYVDAVNMLDGYDEGGNFIGRPPLTQPKE